MSNSHRKSSGRAAVSQSSETKTIEQHTSRRLAWLLRSFIFFTLFYLYLWLYIDLKLMYHGAGIITNFPAFYRGRPFFLQFLSYPGGLIEYISAFLSQFFYYSWAGALVVTIQAWLMCLSLEYLLKAVNSSKSHLIFPADTSACNVHSVYLLLSYNNGFFNRPANCMFVPENDSLVQ